MSRVPISAPSLDQLDLLEFVDPVPASIGHLQRIDRWTHGTYTEYGGPGFWVPMWMRGIQVLTFDIPLSPGVEYYRIRGLVSQRNKTTPRRCEMSLTSDNTGSSTRVAWEEVSGGNTLVGALEIATSDDTSADDGPLRCVSGTSWARDFDRVTADFDIGTGVVWGLLFQPLHTPR